MRLFERTRPLENEIDQLKLKVKTLEDTDKSQSKQVLDLQEVYIYNKGFDLILFTKRLKLIS